MYYRQVFSFITLAIFLASALVSTATCAESISTKEITIPMPEAGEQGLETLLVWPNSPGKHPLALISHGSPRTAEQRAEMSAISNLPVAMEFARRGFAVAVVMRRGYGGSGGSWMEGYGTCQATNYKHAAEESVKDLRAAIQYLSTLPQFDTNRMIAVGVSAGGFATVALTAAPPKGLVAAISFAGGRGSTANDKVCQLDSLVSQFGEFGKTSRVPMLWVYAENDHFFNQDAAQQFLQAFTANGGKVTFIKAPPFGTDGHSLFSRKGIPDWTPYVDSFLKKQNLVLVDDLLPLPQSNLTPPSSLSAKSQKGFNEYLSGAPHKAFAINSNGAFGWSSGKRSVDDAKSQAMTYCEKYAKSDCEIYAVDDTYASHEGKHGAP